jgi:RHS repeat-associated protein
MEAAQEHVFSGSGSDPCVFFPLAAFGGVAENSRLGFARKNPAPHQGSAWSNSARALGIAEVLLETRVGSRYTGKERDPESGLDNFGARYDSSAMGRFTSPDPIFMELHRLADPQSLNLYSYVRNNPLNLTDPTGMLVDIDCSRVNSGQCKQTVTDLNNRKDAQFQVTRDADTGQLNVVGNVDASKLSSSEAELYKAISDPDHTATLDVRPGSDSIMFDQYAGKGLNILDRADLSALGRANSILPGEAIAHAAVEAYAGLAEGKDTYDAAHSFANKFFGDVRVTGLNTLPPGAATATSGQATYNFQRVGVSVNVRKIFIVPQPAASVPTNWERIRGNLIVSTTDQKKQP